MRLWRGRGMLRLTVGARGGHAEVHQRLDELDGARRAFRSDHCAGARRDPPPKGRPIVRAFSAWFARVAPIGGPPPRAAFWSNEAPPKVARQNPRQRPEKRAGAGSKKAPSLTCGIPGYAGWRPPGRADVVDLAVCGT
jgi:hypothetical protein